MGFFLGIFTLNFLFLIGFVILFFRTNVKDSIVRRDSQQNINTLLKEKPTDNNMSVLQIFNVSSLSFYSIIVTVTSSTAIGSFFGEVVSDLESLPQILFFTRLLSDFFGRLVVMYLPLQSDFIIAIASTIRVLLVPIYFILSPVGGVDVILILLVATFSFTTGVIVTGSFQVAPINLNYPTSANLSKQASILNVFLCISINFGVIVSLCILALQ